MRWDKGYQIPDPETGYFKTPNVIYNLGLTPGEILVYCYLLRIEDRSTFDAVAKRSTIAKALGIKTPKTVSRHINGLVEKHLITVKNTVIVHENGAVLNGCLKFHIRPIGDAVCYHHEIEMDRLAEEKVKNKLRKAQSQMN